MERKKCVCWLWVLAGLVSLPWVCSAKPGPLDALFGPLVGLDVPALYDRFQAIIDFGVYLMVFVSVTRFALCRHFSGREGRTIATVAGLILAVALSLTQRQLGFELRAFGPLAAGIFVLVMGVALFQLVHALGAGGAASGAVALIVSYFAVRAVVPGLFEWAQHSVWGHALHGLLVMSVIVAFVRWGIHVAGRSAGKIPAGLWQQKRNSPGKESSRGRQEAALREKLAQVSWQEEKNSQRIIDDLKALRDAVRGYGHLPEAGDCLAEKIRQIMPRKHVAVMRLERLKKMHARLIKGDLSTFRGMKREYGQLPEEVRKKVRAKLVRMSGEILSEKELQGLETRIENYDRKMKKELEAALNSLKKGDSAGAEEALSRAAARENQAKICLTRMKELERQVARQIQTVWESR